VIASAHVEAVRVQSVAPAVLLDHPAVLLLEVALKALLITPERLLAEVALRLCRLGLRLCRQTGLYAPLHHDQCNRPQRL
jgi:hypothetical protein